MVTCARRSRQKRTATCIYSYAQCSYGMPKFVVYEHVHDMHPQYASMRGSHPLHETQLWHDACCSRGPHGSHQRCCARQPITHHCLALLFGLLLVSCMCSCNSRLSARCSCAMPGHDHCMHPAGRDGRIVHRQGTQAHVSCHMFPMALVQRHHHPRCTSAGFALSHTTSNE